MRPSGWGADQLRDIRREPGVAKYAEGSCLARFGDTHVPCAASVEPRAPSWMRDTGRGRVTAEYGMLPRSTRTRTTREASLGKQSGRTLEIQRLIGRSLRAVTNLEAMGEIQVKVDCDGIQADDSTRTVTITGAYVALYGAFECCRSLGVIDALPLNQVVAAVSCGIFNGTPALDLDYEEDRGALADANFVMTASGKFVEIQATAETTPFSEDDYTALMKLARRGVGELVKLQRRALGTP